MHAVKICGGIDSYPRYYMELSGHCHASVDPPRNVPSCPLNGCLSGDQNRSLRFGKGRNFFPLTGIKPRFLGRPATDQAILTFKHHSYLVTLDEGNSNVVVGVPNSNGLCFSQYSVEVYYRTSAHS
jgi:hypothetical protein